MPYYGRGNEVARLNPNTAEVKRVLLPFEESAGVHSSVPTPDGTVWFTEFALNRIAKLDPQTGKITEYQDSGDVPGERPSKHTARVDAEGNVWTSGSPVTKFDPKTGKFTHFMDAPSSYGITFDKEGNVWFCVLKTDGTIGKIDAKTGKVVHWSPPTHGMPQRLDLVRTGSSISVNAKETRSAGLIRRPRRSRNIRCPAPRALPTPLRSIRTTQFGTTPTIRIRSDTWIRIPVKLWSILSHILTD